MVLLAMMLAATAPVQNEHQQDYDHCLFMLSLMKDDGKREVAPLVQQTIPDCNNYREMVKADLKATLDADAGMSPSSRDSVLVDLMKTTDQMLITSVSLQVIDYRHSNAIRR